MSQDHDRREEVCTDCEATEENMDARIISVREDPDTGCYFTLVTWHLDTCPTYTVDRILSEEGVRRAKEQGEWAQREFPAAQERMRQAAAGIDADEAAPFVAALLELVNAQGEDLGRFVPAERWAEILNRHFPPPGGEPTA